MLIALATASLSAQNTGDLLLGFRNDGSGGGTGTTVNTTIDLGSYSTYVSGGSFYSPGVTESTGINLVTDGLGTTYGANFLKDSGLYFGIIGANGNTSGTRVLFVSAVATGPSETPGVANSAAWAIGSIIGQSSQASKFGTLEANNVGGFNGVSTSQTSDSTSWSKVEGNTAGLSFGKYPTGLFEGTVPAGSALDLYELNPQAGGPGSGNPGVFLGTFTIGANGDLDFTAAKGGGGAVVSQPTSQAVAVGGNATFSFSVSAGGTPSYQWYLNGSALSDGPRGSASVAGSSSPTLMLSSVTPALAGAYTCIATTSAGSVASAAASLEVGTVSMQGRLTHISCRALVGTGQNVLIAGFSVGGSGTAGTQPLLIRASGPALGASPFNVPGTLSDPELVVEDTTSAADTILATNSGWGGTSELSSAAAAVGAFPWSQAGSADSAVTATFSEGDYTAEVSGASGDTGVSLVEVYDETPDDAYTAASARLTNVSARGFAGTGNATLIVGFVVGGSTPLNVLIRASGPALPQSPFNVQGALADPQLAVYAGTTLVASNSSWGGTTALSDAASQVGAFPWTDPSSHDSAALVTLQPGPYTVQVSGSSGDTGIALVEIYEVP